MAGREKDSTIQLGLRVRESLRAAIEKSARKKGVSMNAEIVNRLEKSFGPSAEEDLRMSLRALITIMDMQTKLMSLDLSDPDTKEFWATVLAKTGPAAADILKKLEESEK